MSLPQNRLQRKTNHEIECRSAPTRCCLITGSGRSAVAVIAVDGFQAVDLVSQCVRPASPGELMPSQIRYGAWTGALQDEAGGTDAAEESVVVTPLVDGSVEIHCHGGSAATARIVADLRASGALLVPPAQWGQRDLSLLTCEANEILARCLTARTAAIAFDQVRGAMLNWATRHLQAVARGDASLDAIQAEADTIVQLESLGLHLADPFRIVLVGPPNVGKSSLLNAIVGYDRSITFDGAGTTRDVLHAETVIDGWPVRLSDTAGIRESAEPIEREGVERARAVADQADLLLCVTEPALVDTSSSRLSSAIDPFFSSGPSSPSPFSAGLPVIRLLNKSDLWKSPSGGAEVHPAPFDLLTNAITGEGIAELMEAISGKFSQRLPEPGAPVPLNSRQSELLREVVGAATLDQLADALNSLIGFDTVLEKP